MRVWSCCLRTIYVSDVSCCANVTKISCTSTTTSNASVDRSVGDSPLIQVAAAAAQANLLRQQEELERKAAELDRREQELQSRGPTGH